MNVLWNKQIRLQNIWMPDCFGLFYKRDEIIAFFFKDRRNILSVSETDPNPQILHSLHSSETLPLPYSWEIVESSKDVFLLVSDDRGINLRNNKFSYDIPVQLQTVYNQHKRPEKYYTEAPQHIGEFTIYHKGNCGYICKKETLKLWEFTGRAYLYTDMMRWKDRLFFGTGGNGGYFYVLNVYTGLPLLSIKTGGTRCFIQKDNLCYLLKTEKNAQLLCIDLSEGKIISQCNLPGVATINSRISMIDNIIHVITFNVSHTKTNGFTWSCVEI